MYLKINEVSKEDFFKIDNNVKLNFINDGGVYIVKNYLGNNTIQTIRNKLIKIDKKSKPCWHPLVNGCPDYHRKVNNYEKAYVKAITHTFFFHLWYEYNQEWIDMFRDIFIMKQEMLNYKNLKYLKNIPSDGFISRIVVHHYPRGGGYMEEHTDPVNPYTPIQTIIKASKTGKDFFTGGVYIRDPITNKKIFAEPFFDYGDMIVFNQGLLHGVDPIDKDVEMTWSLNDGRFLIIPITVRSDYLKDKVDNPKGISNE